jgi:hypothetical protein
MGWVVNATPRPFYPPGKTRYPLYRRLGGPQGRSGQVQKILPHTGFRSQDRPARSESLYRLSYPGPVHFHEYIYIHIYLNLYIKFKFHQNLTKITGTLHEDRYTFLITSHSVLLTMRNDTNKVAENIKTHFVFDRHFTQKLCRYEMM